MTSYKMIGMCLYHNGMSRGHGFIPHLELSRLTSNQTVDYVARGFMIFMQGVDITRAIGRVGLKVSPVFGPNRTRCRSGPKTGLTFKPTLPMARVMSTPRIKLIKPRAI